MKMFRRNARPDAPRIDEPKAAPSNARWRDVIRVRRSGTVYILISIVLGVIAVNSTNNLLYLTTTVLLGYMLGSGVAGRRNIRSAEVSFTFPDEIYAHVPCPVSVRVRNRNRFVSLFLIDVSLDGKSVFFGSVPPGQTESKTLFVTFPARGSRRVDDENVRLSSIYPFNFFVRWWPTGCREDVTVFPCPLRCGEESAFVREANGEIDAAAPVGDTDVVGVRPYADGDSMKRIHWKSSARTGKLKTRLYDGSAAQNGRVIDLDRLLAGETERGLSMAAWMVTESMKSGLAIGMRCRDRLIPPAPERSHKLGLLRSLALYSGQDFHAEREAC
ncbi:MAG: DUF58 domain-containing protein [Synergistaceae bacterium]|jgi:uncharacterized protein (DUF58 family)|nr:DUF58 domain-containing protein [Synergistaceae bacterium]